MNTDVIVIGVVVGLVNYLFRYLPLRLGPARKQAGLQRGKISLLLDSIGIASICALLVVSSVPEIVRDAHKLIPTLVGFIVICAYFYKTKSIIFATLFGALSYGITFKLLMMG
ncbi:L-valine exporter [Yersinia entomophaga]|uniref:L-valine exporter n=1 Tax=Yersinia entomophaga TaxID=935293 RepID=A0ABN4PW53_YERET|nr:MULTISPECIES: L-valine transporter subunit YgaH [Yersinia]ANI31099.1 L-valine exporter [Yersinia entomophaga]OWF86365.1 L-valine transporter subunit YgaH [Yersinia entomophaga]